MARTHKSFLVGALARLARWRYGALALAGAALLGGVAARSAAALTLYYQFTGELDLYGTFAILHSNEWTGSSIQGNYAGGANVGYYQSLTLHSDGTMTFEESLNDQSFGPVTYDVQDVPLDPYPGSFTSGYGVTESFTNTTGWDAASPSATSDPLGPNNQSMDVDGNGDWVASVSGNLSSCTNGDTVTWFINIYR